MKKLFVLLTVLLALMPAAVFAGGGKESSGSSDGPVTIKYYTWEDAAHKPLIDAFNATHDDIQVDAEILPSANYEARLNTLLAGRVEMDAFMEKRQTDMFVQYNNGYIEPLNDYIVEGTPADGAVKAYESQMVYNGDILGIPWRGGAYYVYYNKKVFDACGVPYPSEYIENGEWTWDKFVEVSKALTNAELGTVGSCIYIWANGTMFIEAQNHKPIIDADGNIDFDDGFLRMLQIKKELEGAGAMVPLTDMKVTGTHYSNLFYNGNLGMLIIGEWFPGQMTTGERDGLLNGFTAADYGICRLPCDAPTYTTLGASTNNHVTSYSKNKDAAYEFISWMAGPEAAAIAAGLGVLPAVATDEVREILAESIPDDGTSLNYFLEDKVNFTPNFGPYGSATEAMIDTFQESYLLGNIPDDQVNAQFQANLEQIVATN